MDRLGLWLFRNSPSEKRMILGRTPTFQSTSYCQSPQISASRQQTLLLPALTEGARHARQDLHLHQKTPYSSPSSRQPWERGRPTATSSLHVEKPRLGFSENPNIISSSVTKQNQNPVLFSGWARMCGLVCAPGSCLHMYCDIIWPVFTLRTAIRITRDCYVEALDSAYYMRNATRE